jgi:hypothetical protein
MRDIFKMTDVVGVEDTVVPHNNCGKKDVGITARFSDFAQIAIYVGGKANRVIVKRIHVYLPQELVEQRLFFGPGFVAKTFKNFIDGDSGDGYLPALLGMCGYPLYHRLIAGKEIG